MTTRTRGPSKREQQRIIRWATSNFDLSYPVFGLRGAFDLSARQQDEVDAFIAAADEVGDSMMSLEDAEALSSQFGVRLYTTNLAPHQHITKRLKGTPGSREFLNGIVALYGSLAVNDAYAAWCSGAAHGAIRARAGIGAEAVGALMQHFAKVRPGLAVCARCEQPRTSGRSFVAQESGDRLLCSTCDDFINRRDEERAVKVDEIAALYDQGMSNHQIAEQTGHSRRFIHGALRARPIRKTCPVCARARRRGVAFGGFEYEDQAGERRTLATCARCIRIQQTKGVVVLPDPDIQRSVSEGESAERS